VDGALLDVLDDAFRAVVDGALALLDVLDDAFFVAIIQISLWWARTAPSRFFSIFAASLTHNQKSLLIINDEQIMYLSKRNVSNGSRLNPCYIY
jgi:hypothetical protein